MPEGRRDVAPMQRHKSRPFLTAGGLPVWNEGQRMKVPVKSCRLIYLITDLFWHCQARSPAVSSSKLRIQFPPVTLRWDIFSASLLRPFQTTPASPSSLSRYLTPGCSGLPMPNDELNQRPTSGPPSPRCSQAAVFSPVLFCQ